MKRPIFALAATVFLLLLSAYYVGEWTPWIIESFKTVDMTPIERSFHDGDFGVGRKMFTTLRNGWSITSIDVDSETWTIAGEIPPAGCGGPTP